MTDAATTATTDATGDPVVTDLVVVADAPVVAAIAGEPTDEEVAAIMAAIEVAWPRPVAAPQFSTEPSRWRFSGRWWSKPLPVRRARP